jgi:NDP-sugar pyrophosphorylase family protein
MSTVALILAGGAGTRMGITGTKIPKVFLHVGLEPVINRPVKRALEINEIETVFVLTRKSHPERPDVDLEAWVKDWRTKYFGEETRIADPLYEEDLEEDLPPLPGVGYEGAVVALARAVQRLRAESCTPSRVLILAGDNFIDESIAPIIEASRADTEAVVIATRSVSNRAQARRRFGVVEVNHVSASGNPVIGYEEKPDDPRSAEVSIGVYCFPFDKLEMVETYLDTLAGLTKDQIKEKAGAPGYFLEWLVENQIPVKAVPLETGNWIDVGTPSSLLASIVQVTKDLVERPKCARDLDVLGSTENLNDKYYFLCHRAKINNDAREKNISLYFQGNDSIASLSGNTDVDSIIPVSAVRKRNLNSNKDFWETLVAQSAQPFSTGDEPRDLEAPILISGGVFLIDRGPASHFLKGTALVPFFIRDFGAPVDAGRLTTAAGRMDKLDILDVCVSEHSEEMIFVGTEIGAANQPRLLICAPPEWRSVARESTLARIAGQGIMLPGIDGGLLSRERRKPLGLVIEPETYPLKPPPGREWTVRIFYREADNDSWLMRHEYKHFVLIPDRLSATIELRVIWLTQLTSHSIRRDGLTPTDPEDMSVGRLLAIADGDGHGRTAVLVRAYDLIDYVSAVGKRSISDTLFSSDVDDDPALRILAATDGKTGRLSAFDRRLPVAPFTTAVYSLVELLKTNLTSIGGA